MGSRTVKKILLGGGTGFIGSHLKRAFEKSGFSVLVVSRNSGAANFTWDELRRNGLPNNIAYIINTAGENVLNPNKRWTEEFKKDVISSRVGTNEILREIVDKSNRKPKAILTLSGVGIYEPHQNKVYDENSDVKPFDFFSKLVLEWENALENISDVRKIIIRSGVVLGNSGGMIKQIIIPFYLGLGGPMGSGVQYFPWIHIDDLTGIILYSIQNDKYEGVVNAVAPQIITNRQFAQAFAKSLNRPALFPMPGLIMRAIFGNERASMILDGQKVRPKKLLDDPNFKFQFSTIDEAVRDISYRWGKKIDC